MEKRDILLDFRTGLEEILREGAQKLLQQAIENEANEFLALHKDRKDENNRRIVKRNGYLPQRQIQTGLGTILVHLKKLHCSHSETELVRYDVRIYGNDRT